MTAHADMIWRGQTDRAVADHERRLDNQARQLDQAIQAIAALRSDVAVIRARLAVYSTVGAVAGGAIAAIVARTIG